MFCIPRNLSEFWSTQFFHSSYERPQSISCAKPRAGELLSEDSLDRRAEPANNPRLTSNPYAKCRKSEDVYAYSSPWNIECRRTLHGAGVIVAVDSCRPSPL